MKSLLVSLPDGFHLHGFLGTGLAERLVSGSPERCSFLVPKGAEVCVPPELLGRADWGFFERVRRPAIERALHYLRMEASARRRDCADWDIVRRRHTGHRVSKTAVAAAASIVARFPALERQLSWVEGRLLPLEVGQLPPLGPEVTVVYGSAGIKQLDSSLSDHLRRSGARRYGVVYSWDNLSTKFNGFYRFDRLAVWNDTMRREAIEEFGYREDQVAVVGPVQFDVYHGYKPTRDRAAFLAEHGLPASARYVLYAGIPRASTPWDGEFAQIVLDADPESFMLFRVHPQDHPNAHPQLLDHPRARVVESARSADGKGEIDLRRLGFWIPQSGQAEQLAEQIYFSDAVVNVASTITLEALLLERPVVNPAYDVREGSFPVSMADYYETRHYGQVARSGAVRIVRSEEELRAAFEGGRARELHFPAEREALLSAIDPYRDGRAAERRAEDIRAVGGGAAPPGEALSA